MEEIGIDLKMEVSFFSARDGLDLDTLELQPDMQDPSLPEQISEKQTLLKSLPVGDEGLYSTHKRLEAHLAFLNLQEVSSVSFRRCPQRLQGRNTSAMKPRTSVESSSERKKR